MELLLDTHVLVWIMDDDPRLKPATRLSIAFSPKVCVSMASLWEMSTKIASGRLTFPGDLEFVMEFLATWNMQVLPVTVDHVRAAAKLPFHHGDPFDRMLVAQANVENMRLVTGDTKISSYAVDVLW